MQGRRGTRKPTPNGDLDLRHDVPASAGIRARGLIRVSDQKKLVDKEESEIFDMQGADEISLPKQEAKIKAYCAAKGYVYTGAHWDVAKGPSPTRPGYLRLIDGGYQGEYDVIICWMGDRLARGMTGAGPLALMWERTNRRIRVEAIEDYFDMDILPVLAWASGKERDNIRKRTMDARLARARRGEIMSARLPYWLIRGKDKKGQLAPDQAAAMRSLLLRYVSGEKTTTLVEWLRTSAPPHLTVPTKWDPDTLPQIFKSTALYGDLQYSARKYFEVEDKATGNMVLEMRRKDDTRDQRVVSDPKLRDEIVITPVPALIHRTDADQIACQDAACPLCWFNGQRLPNYETLQTLIVRRRVTSPGRTKHPYPLRRLVFCDRCDTLMTARVQYYWRKKDAEGNWQKVPYKTPQSFLRCSATHRNQSHEHPCRYTYNMNGRRLWETVKDQVRVIAQQPDLLRQAARDYLEEHARRTPDDGALEAAIEQLARAKEDQADLFDARRELHPDVYRQKNQAALTRIQIYEAEVKRLANERDRLDIAKDLDGDVERVVQILQSRDLDAMDDEQWRELVVVLVNRVVVDYYGQPTLEWVFGNDFLPLESGRSRGHIITLRIPLLGVQPLLAA